MKSIRKRALSLIISLALCLMAVTAAVPTKEASAASKNIKVDAFIKYIVTEMQLQVDKTSRAPYIDAAMKANILKEGDFNNYSTYLTRTDCAVLANRIDKYYNGEHFGYNVEVYDFLKGCEYYDGKLYYNVKGEFYPEGEFDDMVYRASQFLEEEVLPRLSPAFKFNRELDAKYHFTTDDDANILERYIMVGLKNDSQFNVDAFDENDNLILAWQRIVDGERKIKTVYDKRISDLSKITKSKRQDVADVVAKGIIKGYSNGKYVQNRSFKGSSKITVSGAKEVVRLALDKYERAPISPDGQLIRRTNLPKNSAEFPYILECFPNEFYEIKFEFMFYDQYIDGTMKRDYYHYPVVTGNNYILKEYQSLVSVGMEPYEYFDTIISQSEQYLNAIFDVDYRTVDKDWIEKVASSYMPFGGTSIYDKIDKYLTAMKKNHVVVESKVVSLEPSTLYELGGDFYIRAYVKYRITADTVKVEDDYELLFGSIYSTYLVGLKSGEWRYGYYDIKLSCSNVNDRTYLQFGVDPSVGISDWAIRGSK